MIQINWKAVESYCGTVEYVKSNPIVSAEAIVHEICHTYDCIGIAALEEKATGNQKHVADLIRSKYGAANINHYNKSWDYYESEIAVTAMTYLILFPLIDTNVQYQLNQMYSNLCSYSSFWEQYKHEGSEKLFVQYLENDLIISNSTQIRLWLLNNFQVTE